MNLSARSAVLAASLFASSAALAKDPCDGVNIEDDGFGGKVWKLNLNLGTFSLFELKKTPRGFALDTVTGEYNISTKEALPGSLAELVLADGTRFQHTLNTSAAPILMSNGSGTVWEMSFPLNVADLQHLAASPATASRITAGDVTIGGAKIFLGGWAKKLQGAAACFVTMANASAGTTPVAPAPAPAPSPSGSSGGVSGGHGSAPAPSPAPAPAPAAAAAPTPAPGPTALGDNMLGGRVVGRKQLYGSFGYPDLEVGVHLPVGRKFDVTPSFRFAYAQALSVGLPSIALGVSARWQLLEAGDLTGSLIVYEPLTIGLPSIGYPVGLGGVGGVSFGLGLLHPGFLMTYNLMDKVDLDFGLQFNDDLVFGGGTVTFVGSVPVIVGAEANITDDLRVGGRVEGGPWFSSAYGATFVTGYVRAVASVGWSF